MEQKQDICPHCGGTDTVRGKLFDAQIVPHNALSSLNSQKCWFVICRKCGTIIRAYIRYPQDWDNVK